VTDLIDNIIDIAKTNTKEDARKIIAELLEAGVEIKPAPLAMQTKGRFEGIPIASVGHHIGLNGKAANVYKMTPPEPELPPDEIQRQQAELNRQSREYLDKMRGDQ
jgi:hypothetical protein